MTEASSVDAFCRSHGISRRMYYILKNAGTGPREMQVGRRVLISREAAEQWRREREVTSKTEVA
jgi:hypothetical protein